MRRRLKRLQGMTRGEWVVLGVVWAAGFVGFYQVARLRATLAGSALVYVALSPVLLVVYMGITEELRVRTTLWALRLWRAVRSRQLSLHYQPKLDLATGEVHAVEALARWRHSRRGMIPPDVWLPCIERTWMVRPFNLHVLDLALRDAKRWHSAGHEVPVCVNVSPPCIAATTLREEILALLKKHELPATSVQIEVTEPAFAGGEQAERQVKQLRSAGIGLALDDFGVAHSSLARLVALPVDAIKIDRSFVADLAEEPRNTAVVRASVELGHTLGACVVAEGIEDEPTRKRVQALGCDVGQGYLFSRPLDLDAVVAYLDERAGQRHAETEPRSQDDATDVV